MRMALFGIGMVGRPTLEAALESGHDVTALVRDAAKLGIGHPRLTVVEGDALDADSVRRTVEDADAAINMLGVSDKAQPSDLLSRSTRIIIDEMKAAEVPRLVCMSVMGVGDSIAHAGVLGKVVLRLLRDKLRDRQVQEDVIRRSGLEWVIVRPVRIIQGPPTGELVAAPDAEAGLASKVTTGDVAAFLLAQAESPTFVGEAVSLVG